MMPRYRSRLVLIDKDGKKRPASDWREVSAREAGMAKPPKKKPKKR